MKNITVMIALLTLSNNLFGAVGCMDNSDHLQNLRGKYYEGLDSALNIETIFDTDERPLDSKNYRPRYDCTCPCREYVTTDNRGFCTKCLHFGPLDRMNIQNTREASAEDMEQFSLLKKIIESKQARR